MSPFIGKTDSLPIKVPAAPKKEMKAEYDFSKAKRNPYTKRLKKAVTIRLDPAIIDYFKSMSGETDIPRSSKCPPSVPMLIIRDCAIDADLLF